MRTQPYKCTTCARRRSLRFGTYNGEIKCVHCGGNMHLDKARINNDIKSRGERCDCHGSKTKKDPKMVYPGDVAYIQGPHRKGQRGCSFNRDYGISERPVEDNLCPF
jgi:hypothetical protein